MMTSEELYALQHHGIKGQRWGVRRYQNTDGSLTSLGQHRYNRLNSKADKFDAKKEKQIEKIDSSRTRLGKSFHNTRAATAQTKANILRDRANAKTLSEKLGARYGFGSMASVNDALEDYYSRQKDYRKTKLGKHLSSVNEYNQHSYGEANERVYQSKGLINKGKNIIKADINTNVKTLVGRDTKTGEHFVRKAVKKMTDDKVDVTLLMDAGYVGIKAAKKVKEKLSKD